MLAELYDKGCCKSIPQNSIRSFELYSLASDQGFASAQYNLGRLYFHGQGVQQSYEKSRRWMEKAAAQGLEHAIDALELFAGMDGNSNKRITSPSPVSVSADQNLFMI